MNDILPPPAKMNKSIKIFFESLSQTADTKMKF